MTAPHVLVTGATRGIGRAIANRFAKEGARVAVAARDATAVDEVVAEIEAAGGTALPCQLNVRDHGSVESAVYRAIEWAGGKLDVLVNNAGVFDVCEFSKITRADWARQIETNLTGVFYVTQECLDAVEASDRGTIINIASVAAREAFPGNVHYCASKYGLRGFSDALRVDLADKGVRVSTVYPGATDTTIFDKVEGDWDRSKMNQPEDVAEVVWKVWAAGPDEDIDNVDVPAPA